VLAAAEFAGNPMVRKAVELKKWLELLDSQESVR
jgi:hypothetical protein